MEAQTDRYRILFSGRTLDGLDLETAKSNIRKMLKASEETIGRLFSGQTVVLKKDLDRQQAEKYVYALSQAGLVVNTQPPLAEASGIDPEKAAAPATEPQVRGASDAEKPSPAQDNPYSSPAAEDLLPSVHCRQCGAQIGQTDATCQRCGARQPIGTPRSKVAAGLLAIFLGWLGAHRFYLGQWWGLLYFLLGFLIWPITIIEGIVFLLTPKDRWDAKYASTRPLNGVILVVVGILVFVVIAGILAAIAIPQYAEYVSRAKIHEAMPTIEQTRERVERYILAENKLPDSNRQAGLPEEISGKNLLSIAVEPGGGMRVTFAAEGSSLDAKSIVWIPELRDGRVYWDCSGGDMPARYRPKQCRQGNFEVEQRAADLRRLVADNGLVDLSVPQSWKPMELAEDAIVQAGNPYSEAYLMVHFDPKAELPGYDLKGYTDAVLDLMSQNLGNPKIQFLRNTGVNGLPALHYRVDGQINDLDAAYLMAIVEGEDHFYQVVTWTLLSRLSGNEDDFNGAINSFRERNSESPQPQ